MCISLMQTNDILLLVSSILLVISELLPFVPVGYQGIVQGLVIQGDEIVQCLNKPKTPQTGLP